MAEISAPRDSTIRRLFALSTNQCAFPGCTTPVLDPQTNTILAEVCHIHAQNSRGSRFDASQSQEERHSFENLVLLCGAHHKIVDAAENVHIYTAAKLRELKGKHEALARTRGTDPPPLTEDQVHSLQETSRSYEINAVHMDFSNAVLSAGGQGGQAGGGGGGGGVIQIVGISRLPASQSAPHELAKQTEVPTVELAGKKASGYGGGGGGGGVLHFVGRPSTEQDVKNGLRISSMFTANSIAISGLFNVLGGAWSYCPLESVPAPVTIKVVCVVETGTIAAESLLRLELDVLNPQREIVLTDPFDVAVQENAGLTPRIPVARYLHFEVAQFGAWNMVLRSGDILLATYGIEFRQGKPVQA